MNVNLAVLLRQVAVQLFDLVITIKRLSILKEKKLPIRNNDFLATYAVLRVHLYSLFNLHTVFFVKITNLENQEF
jgi:hypothetical protein